ncbi:MAG: DUF3558 domain-containing protein [Kibdelosporangium sp.]
MLTAALASCSVSTAGTPVAAFRAEPPTTRVGAPRVADPLNVAKFFSNLCAVLTPDRAKAVANLVRTRTSVNDRGQTCHWNDEGFNGVSISLIRGNGLSDVYGTRGYGSGYFEVAPDTAGYPGVYSSGSDARPDGVCTMGVGIRDDVVMAVTSLLDATSPYRNDPCSLARRAAEAAIATIKENA